MFFRDILLNQVLSLATSTFKTRHFFGSWQSRCVLKIAQDSFVLFSSFIVKIRLILKLIDMIILNFKPHVAFGNWSQISFWLLFPSFHNCFLFFMPIQYAGKRNGFQVCICAKLAMFFISHKLGLFLLNFPFTAQFTHFQ